MIRQIRMMTMITVESHRPSMMTMAIRPVALSMYR
jgi:hypothetical protein